MVYEELKRLLSKNATDSHRQNLTSLEITLVGAASKLFATLSTYPLAVRLSNHLGTSDMEPNNLIRFRSRAAFEVFASSLYL